jgi:site-specific recombinase XerD
VLDFLDYLETERGNSARTRNARLVAIRSFMRYAAVCDPASLPMTGGAGHPGQTVRPARARLPHPRTGRRDPGRTDRSAWSGHRDAVLLATAHNTGARVSEITVLRVRDVLLAPVFR